MKMVAVNVVVSGNKKEILTVLIVKDFVLVDKDT